MKRLEKICLLLLIIVMPCVMRGKSVEEEKIEQIKVGNFALPVSQQAGPMIAFGQNMPGKGVWQGWGYYDQLVGVNEDFKSVIPSVLYGIMDRLSFLAQFPIAAKFREDNNTSHGVGDFTAQLEGVAYVKETTTTVDEITLVGNISVPTGLASATPATGFGSPTIFLGFTAGRTTPRWYYYTSMGANLTTKHDGTKFGNQFVYQFGLGGNILYSADKYIFNWLVELDGIFIQRSKIAGTIACDTGGNRVLLGPSLWFSTRRVFLQAGVSGLIAQHLFGAGQHRERYLVVGGIGVTF
jgi:hypothetical protein